MAVVDLDEYDVQPDAFRLVNLLSGILERLEAVYLSYGVPLPTRRYYMSGEPAYDCEQAVVSLIQGYIGAPGDQASRPVHCNQPRTAIVQISIVRQAAALGKSGTPKPEAIQKSADISLVDSMVLLESLEQFDRWNDEGPGLGIIATVTQTTPAGEYQSTEMQLTLAIP